MLKSNISMWPWFKKALDFHLKLSFVGGNNSNVHSKRFLALALCGEAGELANKIKKEWRGDKEDFVGIRKEIADCVVYIMLLAHAYDIDDIHKEVDSKLDEFFKRNKN